MAEKHVHKVYGSFPPWGKSVEFPASGGGGNYVYYNKPSDGNLSTFVQFASVGKVVMNDIIRFMSATEVVLYNIHADNILALGVDMSLKVTDYETLKLVTIGEILDAIGEDLPRLTEDEFYLKSHFMITNGILNADDSTLPLTFKYDEGMTWREWINSPYNAYGYFIEGQQVIGVFVRKTREGFPESCPIAYSGFDGSVTVTPDEKIEGRGYFIYV